VIVLIVFGVFVGGALLIGWRIDRKDHRGGGRSVKASTMTRDAMRHREMFRRKAGR